MNAVGRRLRIVLSGKEFLEIRCLGPETRDSRAQGVEPEQGASLSRMAKLPTLLDKLHIPAQIHGGLFIWIRPRAQRAGAVLCAYASAHIYVYRTP